MSDRTTQMQIGRRLTDEPAVAKDNKESNPDGLSEVDEAVEELSCVVSMVGVLLNILETNATNGVCIGMWEGNEKPDDTGNSKEDGSEEEAVVVSKLGNGG